MVVNTASPSPQSFCVIAKLGAVEHPAIPTVSACSRKPNHRASDGAVLSAHCLPSHYFSSLSSLCLVIFPDGFLLVLPSGSPHYFLVGKVNIAYIAHYHIASANGPFSFSVLIFFFVFVHLEDVT
jgi:hypothetical protein